MVIRNIKDNDNLINFYTLVKMLGMKKSAIRDKVLNVSYNEITKSFVERYFLSTNDQLSFFEGNTNFLYDYNIARESVVKEFGKLKDSDFVIPYDSDYYPEGIKKYIKDYPLFIFGRGNINLLKKKEKIAVIGSRDASKFELEKTTEVVNKLSNRDDIVIVSGLALGIDSKAHQEAIRNEIPTISVIAEPLTKSYSSKKEIGQLREKIEKDHLLLTQYSPIENKIQRYFFINRNKIMASISKASVAMSIKDGSGTLTQLDFCIKNNIDFYIDESQKLKNLKWYKDKNINFF